MIGFHSNAHPLEQYTDNAIAFGVWCKSNFACRTFEDCRQHIQAYANHLTAEGKSPDTIHTYLAGVCFVWDVPLQDITKPIRHTADAIRSRGTKESDQRSDTQRACSPRLYDFASVMCLRRHDYVALRQNNFVTDECGYPCVEVCKGKGEILKRWATYNERPLQLHEMQGTYVMRGKNRTFAVELGIDYELDRLAVLATSIYHLSHWRNGVAVRNYILVGLTDEAMHKKKNESEAELYA